MINIPKQLALFTTMLLHWLLISDCRKSSSDSSYSSDDSNSNSNQNNEYDFIIVGAGTGGTMVATELASYYGTHANILLIEEGSYSSLNPDINDLNEALLLPEDLTVNRDYNTISERNLFGRVIPLNRAKVTGGCNSVNYNMYLLANENDFTDLWNNIDGWSLDEVLDVWDEITEVNEGHQYNASNPMMKRFITAAEENGYEFNENWNDLRNGGTQEGACPLITQATVNGSNSFVKRRSVWTDFMEPLLPPSENGISLDILPLTRVNKVLLEDVKSGKSGKKGSKKDSSDDSSDDEDDGYYEKKAVGVEAYDVGTKEVTNYYANKEVIICGGAYDTPKILMLSGIGDCDELEKFGIECEVNIPGVGQNLQDHLVMPTSTHFLTDSERIELWEKEIPDVVLQNEDLWWFLGAISQQGKYLHLMLTGVWTADDLEGFGIDLAANGLEGIDEVIHIGTAVVLQHLTSRGNVTLSDSDPSSKPVIDHNYLDTYEDLLAVSEAIDIGRDLIYNSSSLMGSYIFNESYEVNPGIEFDTFEEKVIFGKFAATTLYHGSGTCKMGNLTTILDKDNEENENIVVDERLRVRNIKNLRVADASIMPFTVSANTNQMTMVIGKKAGKMIIEDNE